jgi:hypothetical protein
MRHVYATVHPHDISFTEYKATFIAHQHGCRYELTIFLGAYRF